MARTVHPVRLGIAIGASAAVVLAAPFLGLVRNQLSAAFPGTFITATAAGVALALVAAVGLAAWRIRDRRGRRYAGLAASLVLIAGYAAAFRTGNAAVDAVEAVHFVEYGLLAALYYRAFLPAAGPAALVLALLSGVLVGIGEEWVQWLVPIRVGVVQDVLLDVVALAAGLAFAASLEPPGAWRAGGDAWRRAARLGAVAIVALAGFVHAVHLGHDVADPEVGMFRSSFTREELLAARTARAQAWRTNPPRRLAVIGIEDRYLTEAGWHAQARNEAEARGAFRIAALENRLLEKYFDPFLDLESFAGRGRHRWPPEQRDNVEAAARARSNAGEAHDPLAPSTYVSEVLRDRIAVWPTAGALWLGTSLLAALLWVTSFIPFLPGR